MVNRVDGIILGVGVVVLAASIIGVVLYEDEGETEWTITWDQGDATQMADVSDSGQAGEYTLEADILQSRLAMTAFTVDVTTGSPQLNQDNIDVTVEGPDGQTGDCSFTIAGPSQQGGSGTCDVEVEAQDAPEPTRITAVNETIAAEQAIEDSDLTAGNGTWTITVTIVGGQELQEPNYTISVTPSYTTWEPTVRPPGENIGRGAG